MRDFLLAMLAGVVLTISFELVTSAADSASANTPVVPVQTPSAPSAPYSYNY